MGQHNPVGSVAIQLVDFIRDPSEAICALAGGLQREFLGTDEPTRDVIPSRAAVTCDRKVDDSSVQP
ncbi:hypothetical protein halTADL_3033 [Halohasta litchfieldiae]|jgi:hypothetical protein|uniref:Uncharacterized protein n=1 Tax=Halohasta litchfieldiae TaxID=1073996 RepID=A0A1H6RLV5_9EURY|nr:hypothetical protein [Halohasta litchfieldiae]ATW89735.1 hypothetical protein halTADL_3033 [Halohasta litchfieldiae]SEI53527.1 hypothetical protein SAMN05444271_10292 [Halohasta litchfieldiae]